MAVERRPFPPEEWIPIFSFRLMFLQPAFSDEVAVAIAQVEYLWAGASCPEAAAEFYALRDAQAQDQVSAPRRRPIGKARTDFGQLS
jgi:hypothetical protein